MRACRISMSPTHWVPARLFVYDISVYDLSLYPTDLRWNVLTIPRSSPTGAGAAR